MSTKRLLLLVLLFFSIALLVPRVSKAVSLQEVLSSEDSIIVKVQEGIEYFFTFRVEQKVQVLEKHAEKRLTMAQNYAEDGEGERIQNLMQNYLQIKAKQNDLLGKTSSEDVLGAVEERTIEQQKTMESIKTKVEGDQKQLVVQTQEQVVNQVAKQVVEANGPEGATEFLNQAAHVWAPGTGPGEGEAGVVYAGGGKLIYAPGTGPGGQAGVVIEGGEMRFAPGTSAGGPAGSDIKTVEIKTGGMVNDSVPVDSGSNMAPGTVQDSPGNTIDPGTVDSNSGKQTIDP